MGPDDRSVQTRFQPLRLASRTRVVVAWILGPLMWTAAFASVAWLVDRSDAIEVGLAIAAASVLGGVIVLTLFRAARVREEKRHAHSR